MRENPRHRMLAPVFIGQPLIMCALAALILLVASFGWGVLKACFQLWQLEGVAGFLPSTSGWWLVIPAGLCVGIFNIACEAAEIDACQGRRRLSVYTHGLLMLSLVFFGRWFEGAVSGTQAEAWLLHPLGFAVSIGLAYAGGVLLVRSHHNEHYQREQRILAAHAERDGAALSGPF